jgi:hypothetical protein
MGGGAWPFLVGGVICLVNSVNERDLSLLNSYANLSTQGGAGLCRRACLAVQLAGAPSQIRRQLLRGTNGV